jgi:UDP-N-acetylmuramoyl-L-alanyl-D-glutamate--2,6-diaminopimelate ligase
MEASSHALHQKRAAALDFYIGVFTNLTGDHLDYHRTTEAYFDAKAMLFESLPSEGYAILNGDDPMAIRMASRSRGHVIRCSLRDPNTECFARVGAQSLNAIETIFAGPWGKFDLTLPLIGKHNVSNAMQAAAVCHFLGLSGDALAGGLSRCTAPPGRLEPVTRAGDGFAVLVDYAHTDDALDNVLRSLRPIVDSEGRGKLRVVFGCGGDRDRTKRPRMAAVACRYADDVIITSDNPRTEDPDAIIEEICAGLPDDRVKSATCIVDRAQAIETAVGRTHNGDILVIAGKGHEDYQIVGLDKRPFDDREVAATALARRRRKVVAA